MYRTAVFPAGIAGDRDSVEHRCTRHAAMIDPPATTGARANARNARARAKGAVTLSPAGVKGAVEWDCCQ